ncbi:hypothetical protein D9757_006804 [Collybiopsis confluens]|uniref:histone acetyltransferase n=1 Tax=Collybiopsis confluens TaxID=2823264 RepID=A0A8H5M9F2_9AGAR|nr:hypothetical protein D9757_006804 [Collybiopsis confluens]
MPATHTVAVTLQIPSNTVLKHDRDEPVIILQESESETVGPRVYVHYVNLDKRNDEWVPRSSLQPIVSNAMAPSTPSSTTAVPLNPKKRKRPSSRTQSASLQSDHEEVEEEQQQQEPQPEQQPQPQPPPPPHQQQEEEEEELLEFISQTMVEQVTMTEEEYDLQRHKQLNTRRNFDLVYIGDWLIKTWYFSPYPLTESEDVESLSAPQGSNIAINRIPGISRTTNRAHGRTSDMLAAGMGRKVEKEILYVCNMCFKYMTEASTWTAHKRGCYVNHPPGRKVYQRGAHTIWEVDGVKEKLYCQNLSLFGKLFIDIKTLFFDCDPFLFYILTDATSSSDHMIGFFSKEKISYDDYNLACILTLPPFQRKGFGRLMIEFSYELSRRAGKVGTPERPLSDLGLRSYLAFWVSTLVRFFRKLLEVMPVSNRAISSSSNNSNNSIIITHGAPPDFRSPSRELSAVSAVSDEGGGVGGVGRRGSSTSSFSSGMRRKKKRVKGWDGEVSQEEDFVDDVDEKLAAFRTFVTTRNPDGSATVHLKVHCSLSDIAKATNLRVEDTAFALGEMGMLDKWGKGKKRRKREGSRLNGNGNGYGDGDGDHKVHTNRTGNGEEGKGMEEGNGRGDQMIILTREMVEKAAKERGVKGLAVLNLNHIKM